MIFLIFLYGILEKSPFVNYCYITWQNVFLGGYVFKLKKGGDLIKISIFKRLYLSVLAFELILKATEEYKYHEHPFTYHQFEEYLIDEVADSIPKLHIREWSIFLLILVLCSILSEKCYRWFIHIIALGYNYMYFFSILDLYQHHYFTCMILIVMTFMNEDYYINLMATRTVLLTASIVYFYASITKLHPVYLTGKLMPLMLISQRSFLLKNFISSVLATFVSEEILWTLMSWMSVFSELIFSMGLMLTSLTPKQIIKKKRYYFDIANEILFFGGIVFHLFIEFFMGFKIGLFSYYMFAIYLLIYPRKFHDRMTAIIVTARNSVIIKLFSSCLYTQHIAHLRVGNKKAFNGFLGQKDD